MNWAKGRGSTHRATQEPLDFFFVFFFTFDGLEWEMSIKSLHNRKYFNTEYSISVLSPVYLSYYRWLVYDLYSYDSVPVAEKLLGGVIVNRLL